MAGRLITPPDIIPSNNSVLIINASETELLTLILWLKTTSDDFDIHLYRNDMKNQNWLSAVLQSVPIVLSSTLEISPIENQHNTKIVHFGKNTKFDFLLDFFLQKTSDT